MVSALYQSRSREKGGTRDFNIDSCSFGWSVIEDMYRRDLDRIKNGHCSRVPKMKESYICRDSWTRLNVQPSKIMQVKLFTYLISYWLINGHVHNSSNFFHANHNNYQCFIQDVSFGRGMGWGTCFVSVVTEQCCLSVDLLCSLIPLGRIGI